MKAHCLILLSFLSVRLFASDLDTIGVSLLRQADPSLNGNGIPVAQVEAPENTNSPPPFEVSPGAVGQPTSLFTWHSDLGSATTFPNSVGASSSHANSVAANFFSASTGPAPQVSHVDSYEANHFFNSVIFPANAISARIVNQSFIFSTNDESLVNPAYDDYAAQFGTLFISGIGNGDVSVSPPGSAYNGIGVGVYDGFSAIGPTHDGRSKPDITSPGSGVTSFSTPFVSASATLLMQAGIRGDGGADTNSAADARILKALLLNGAIKPSAWTNGPSAPLDARYGAGVFNVFNSWEQLRGGKHAFIESTSVTNNTPHPPGTNTNNEPALSGWDFNTIATSPATKDKINHYYFNLPGTAAFTLTTTLIWNKQTNQTSINDLNLFLYNAANSNLVACSTSLVDNVEHIFVPSLPAGRYDLQVLKKGSSTPSVTETYALAFEFFNLNLNIAVSNANTIVSWPIYPTGFHLQSTTNLSSPVWTNVTAAIAVDTNTSLNVVTLPTSQANRFFRLQRP